MRNYMLQMTGDGGGRVRRGSDWGSGGRARLIGGVVPHLHPLSSFLRGGRFFGFSWPLSQLSPGRSRSSCRRSNSSNPKTLRARRSPDRSSSLCADISGQASNATGSPDRRARTPVDTSGPSGWTLRDTSACLSVEDVVPRALPLRCSSHGLDSEI